MQIGEKYEELKKTISIAILDYNLEKLRKTEEAHTIWHIREDNAPELKLTDDLEIHIIELPKVREMRKNGKENAVIDWMLFLDDPNNEEVSEIVKSKKEIDEAMKKLEEITSDEEMMRIIELRKKAIWDENQRRYVAEKEATEAKIRGRAEGLEEGRAEGRAEEKIEIAKKLIQLNMPINDISKITNLTEEEIKSIVI